MARRDELDWDDLQYFLHAAREKTLSGAARASGVEHTTIGRRLSALERALGAALFLRGPDGLRLTALGERIVPLAEDVERAVGAVRNCTRTQARVRLAMPSGMTALFSAGLAQLRHERPELALEIVSGARPVDLKRGEAELAIRSGPVTDPELVVRKLCDSGFSLYASAAYLARRPAPANLDDLGGHDIIGYDPALAAVPAAVWLDARAHNATVVLRSREMTEMLSAAASGAGLAVLPCMLADYEPALKRLTRELIAKTPLSLVHRREAKLSPDVRAVIRFVVATMRAHETKIRGGRG